MGRGSSVSVAGPSGTEVLVTLAMSSQWPFDRASLRAEERAGDEQLVCPLISYSFLLFVSLLSLLLEPSLCLSLPLSRAQGPASFAYWAHVGGSEVVAGLLRRFEVLLSPADEKHRILELLQANGKRQTQSLIAN